MGVVVVYYGERCWCVGLDAGLRISWLWRLIVFLALWLFVYCDLFCLVVFVGYVSCCWWACGVYCCLLRGLFV